MNESGDMCFFLFLIGEEADRRGIRRNNMYSNKFVAYSFAWGVLLPYIDVHR